MNYALHCSANEIFEGKIGFYCYHNFYILGLSSVHVVMKQSLKEGTKTLKDACISNTKIVREFTDR